MAVQFKNPPTIVKRLFTVEEYHRLGEAGILSEDDRVELIQGELLQMSPIGSVHAFCVSRLDHLLQMALGERAEIRAQNPIQLDERSEPQSDIVAAKPRKDGYARAHPKPSDIFLIVEVSDTTLEKDRSFKVPLYARAGIPETWVVDLNQDTIEQFSEPRNGDYAKHRVVHRGETLQSLGVPNLTLAVNDILGE